MSSRELNAHEQANQAAWNQFAEEYVEPGRRNWASDEPSWGMFGVPESDVGILPDVNGLDVIEMGCGTAYWSAWMARRGARPVGVDLSERQLETARELQKEHGLEFPLMHESAERVPLPDASFDLAFSEYGACLWCDPYVWIPECARLLRPGGRLLFLTGSVIRVLCSPISGEPLGRTLVNDQFGLNAITWPDDGSTDFTLPHGERIRVLREAGFEIERLHELQVPGDVELEQYPWMPKDWGNRWPCEEIWLARKSAETVDN
ncbi:MAG TPA: class I SAM-dependent methyltransferase [Thermoleophilaceae bacterium]|jgi:SAM-dependent methyltransferase